MSLENNNFISNNMNAILRRKRSIEIKRLNKEIKKNKELEEKLNKLKEERKQDRETIRKLKDDNKKFNKERYDLLRVPEYRETSSKLPKEERLKNYLDKVYENKGKREISTVLEKRKYDRRAFNNSFQEIIIEDENFLNNPSEWLEDEEIIPIKQLSFENIENIIRKELYDFHFNSSKEFNFQASLTIAFTVYKLSPLVDRAPTEKQIQQDIIKNNRKTFYQFDTAYYNSKFAQTLKNKNQIDEWINEEIEEFKDRIDYYTDKGSGWLLWNVNKIIIQLQKTPKTRAGSYILLPDVLKNKRAIVNIKNKDNRCILFCISAFHNYDNIKSKDKNETYHYKDISKYEPKI
jgi:hypothetical protein